MYKCINCKKSDFNLLLKYKNYSVVSSDNKLEKCNFTLIECKNCFLVQKIINDDIKIIINKIYNEYTSYYLNNGKEEFLEINNQATNRSKEIIKNISGFIKQTGKILDIGSGSGVFLEEFSNNFSWDLYAQDLKDNIALSLYKKSFFKKLYLKNLNEIEERNFDLISGIHVFEHIIEQNDFLKDIKTLLKDDGILLLQVPYIDKNLFDIFIIDHISHFNYNSLYNTLIKHFNYISFSVSQIDKEITVIASNSNLKDKNKEISIKRIEYEAIIKQLIDKLHSLDNSDIAIFGTTPPALFCAQFFNMKIKYFIDENKNKCSKKLYSKSIISPEEVDKNTKILVPYSRNLFEKISTKYPNLNFIYLGTE